MQYINIYTKRYFITKSIKSDFFHTRRYGFGTQCALPENKNKKKNILRRQSVFSSWNHVRQLNTLYMTVYLYINPVDNKKREKHGKIESDQQWYNDMRLNWSHESNTNLTHANVLTYV